MFSYEFTKESQTSSISIDGYNSLAVLIMIQWFYSGRFNVPDRDLCKLYSVETLNDITQISDDILLDCTELANKYVLDDMQVNFKAIYYGNIGYYVTLKFRNSVTMNGKID